MRAIAGGAGSGSRFFKDNGGHKFVRALDNLSFEVTSGIRLGLLGSNGAGKSTLLKMIAGIYPPSAGRLDIGGTISSVLNLGIGMDFDATGRDNIVLMGYLRGLTRQESETHIEDVIEFADIGDFIDMPIRTYSAGMTARLSFALATTIVPDILLLDEIVAAGDAAFVNKSRLRMENVMERARILIFASHANNLIRAYCNKGLVMNQGRLVFLGDIDEAIAIHEQQQLAQAQ
jgi:ABC-2 type transport system ATP-binding protein/lipopolysaccharide transport system ATP-binding protein